MGNPYFRFKQFEIRQDKCAMKVTTDACLFGAWVGSLVQKDSKALDIGAGTGLLSLMMAQQNISLVESVEIEASCYQQLVENIGLSPWRQKVIPHLSDISKWTTDKLFDIVLYI
jgi:tRNA1Val (adenine37-N6)-methyltransferase